MNFIENLNNRLFWGIPMLALMFILGIWLSIASQGIIFFKFGKVLKYGLKSILKKDSQENGVSPFAAVSTALAATIGTGNIVGVAIAIRTGGPGAIFWMWISAFLGMVIKYSEVSLAVFYQKKDNGGNFYGGPMYYISECTGLKKPALMFSFFGMLSSFGIGNMVQANALSGGAYAMLGISKPICGIILSILCGAVLIGGIKRISSITEILVPFMALFYIFISLSVIFINREQLPNAFADIFRYAFSPISATGGFLGSSVSYAMRIGVSRGLFTNEAGLGSAPIAHAAANCKHPAHQGFLGALEVFFDTIVMCTITALVILTDGVWRTPETGEEFLTHTAFSSAIPFGGEAVCFGLILFAFASIIAWYYYGEKCFEFIFGQKKVSFYRVLYVSACFFGCVFRSGAVWEAADTLNALMAIPNLISLFFCFEKIREITKDFLSKY